MPITLVDSAKGNTGTTASTTGTFSTVVSPGSDILIVTLGMRNTTVSTGKTVTFNGLSLTKLATDMLTDTRAELWYLVDPPAMTANLVITLNASQFWEYTMATYSGVNKGDPWGNVATNTAVSTSVSATIASAVGELVIDAVAKKGTTEVITQDASQTLVQVGRPGTSTATDSAWSGQSYKDGAASVTMTWTWPTTNRNSAIVVAALKPAGGRQFQAIWMS